MKWSGRERGFGQAGVMRSVEVLGGEHRRAQRRLSAFVVLRLEPRVLEHASTTIVAVLSAPRSRGPVAVCGPWLKAPFARRLVSGGPPRSPDCRARPASAHCPGRRSPILVDQHDVEAETAPRTWRLLLSHRPAPSTHDLIVLLLGHPSGRPGQLLASCSQKNSGGSGSWRRDRAAATRHIARSRP